MKTCAMCGTLADKYGLRWNDEAPICYPCCAEIDRQDMKETGRFDGYLTKKDGRWVVTNWPGSLRFVVRSMTTRRHNWYGVKQVYVWFFGPEGKTWMGRHVSGGRTEIVRCRRLKGG